MKKIAILGCGWLGLPLAKSLVDKGFSVKGSTTSEEKVSILNNFGISAFQIELTENYISGDISSFLEDSEILIIDIPPKLKGNNNENFVKKIENFVPFIEESSVENVIFISSTSVYPDLPLENNNQNVYTEETKAAPNLENGRQLVEVEHLLQNNTNFKTNVIRFGGLIGEDRQPVRSLSGNKMLQNPSAPINLIHQKDCIGIIETIIEKNAWNETFNAAAPFHPTRKEYYTQKAIELNLAAPQFETSEPNFGKTISSCKIDSILKYVFQKPML